MDEVTDDDLDALYRRVDALLRAGAFGAVDAEVAALDVGAPPILALLAWLSITSAAEDRLPARAAFAEAVTTRVRAERGEEEARGLLRGLVGEGTWKRN